MSDEFGGVVDLQPHSDSKQGNKNPLGFSLEFRESAALVTLKDRELPQGIKLKRLVLEVPEVKFPFDVEGGAEQFRHHRCLLRSLSVSMSQKAGQGMLEKLLDPVRYGVEKAELSFQDGHGLITGVWHLGDRRAFVSIRFMAEGRDNMSVRIGLTDVRVYGYIPMPISALVAQLGRALKPLGVEVKDGGYFELSPVRDLVRWLLPSNGWKIPDLEGLRVGRIIIGEGDVRLVVARYPDEELEDEEIAPISEESVYEQQFLLLKEGIEAFGQAEQALTEGRLEEARKLYLGKGGIEPMHPHAARRMLEIGMTNPESFDELEDLVQDLLDKDQLFLPAWFAKAVMQEQRKKPGAGGTYEKIAELAVERAERKDAILAYLKAGSLLREVDIEQSVRDFEKVLELDPDHCDAMRTLGELYENQQQSYRALRIYLRLVRRLDTDQEMALCHVRMGKIMMDRLDDPEGARKHFNSALMHQPENLEALDAQAALSESRGQFTRAAKLLLRRMELLDPDRQSQELLETRLRLAKVREAHLDDPASALFYYEQILQNHPDNVESLERVGSIHAAQENWDQASAAFSRLLDMEAAGKTLDDRLIKSACFTLGRISNLRQEGRQEARRYLRRAAKLDQNDLAVWSELEKIDREDRAWPDLVEDLERKAQLLEQPGEILGVVLEAARISDRQLGDRQRAEMLYERALEIQPALPEAVEGLAFLLTEEKRWEELAEIMTQAAGVDEDHKRAANRWAELSKIHIEKLDDLEAGTWAVQQAVDLDPHRKSNVDTLLALYRQQERYQELVDLVSSLPTEGWDEASLVELHLERARILEQLGQRQESVLSYRRVLEIQPGAREACRSLIELYLADEKLDLAQEAILQLLDQAGEGELSEPEMIDLRRKLAQVAISQGNRDAAIEQYELIIEKTEIDPDSASCLERLLSEEERWEDLAELQARLAEKQKGATRADLYAKAAVIWHEKLSGLEPAAVYYRKAVQADPQGEQMPQLLGSLQGVLRRLGNWPEVVEVLNSRITLSEPEDKIKLYMLLAAVFDARMGDVGSALECWEQVVQIDPTHRPALIMLTRKSHKKGGLEKTLEYGQRALESDSLDLRLSRQSRAGLALEAARAAWSLDWQEDAIRMYTVHMETFEQDQYAGVHPEALERLTLLLRTQQKYEDLAAVYRRWLSSGTLPERHGDVRREWAKLLCEHLSEPEQALELLTQHILENPDDQGAVSDLMLVLRESGQWDQLASLLERQWDRAVDEDLRIQHLEELAQIYQEHLQDGERAVWAWKELLDMGHQAAAERLCSVYRQEGRYHELADLLRYRAENAVDEHQGREQWVEYAEVCLTRLGERDQALKSFRRAMEIQADEEVVQRLQSLYQEDENWPAVLEMQELLVSMEKDPAGMARRLYRLGQIYCQHTASPQKAVEALERAASLDPTWLQPLHELAGLFVKQEQWRQLLDVKKRLAEVESLGESKAEHFQEIARLAFDKLEEPSLGIELLWKAADEISDPVAIWQELADRCEQNQLYDQAADAVERMVEQGGGISEVTETPATLYRRLAELRESAGQPRKAIEAYRECLRLEPSDAMSAGRLEILYRAEGRLDEIAIMKQELASRLTGRPAADIWMSCAESWLEAGDDQNAIRALDQALRMAPDHEESSELMVQLLARQEAWETMLDFLLKIPDQLFEREAVRQNVGHGMQQLLAGRLEPEQEVAACRIFLRLNPEHMPTWLRLAGLLSEHGEPVEYESVLRQIDGNADKLTVDQRSELDLVLAQFDFSRGQAHMAEERLRRCIAAKPEESKPRELLHKLLSGGDRVADQVVLLLEEAEKASSPEQHFEKLFKAAELKERELGDPKGAAVLIERLTEQDPDNLEAWNRLEDLYRLVDDPGKRRDALMQVSRLSIGKSACQALRKVARLTQHQLDEPEAARKAWIELLELEPDDQEALDKLLELDRKENRYEELQQRLHKRSSLTQEPDLRASLLRERVEILLEKVHQPDRALESLEQLEQLTPDDVTVLQQLGTVYEQQKRFDKLSDNLQRRISQASSEPVRAALWGKLANVRQQHLNDIQGTVEALRKAVAHESEDPTPLLQRLRRLASESGDQVLLLEVLEALIVRSEDVRQQHWLHRAVGLLKWSAGSKQEAKRSFLQALQLDPDDIVSKRFLIEALYPEDPQASIPHIKWLLEHADILTPYELRKLQARLVQALAQSDPAEQMEALEGLLKLYPKDLKVTQELASLYQRVGRQQAYADLLARIGELQGAEPAAACWVERGDILVGEGQVQEAVSAYRQALELPGDHRYQVIRRLAKLQLTELHDERAASESLELGLEIQPNDVNILRQLVDLYVSMSSWERAGELIHRLKDLPGQERDVNLLLRVGEIDYRQNRIDDALDAFRRVIQLDPAVRFAYQYIEKILFNKQDNDELAKLYLSWARSPASGERRAALYAAALEYLEDRADTDLVIQVLKECLDVDPSNLDTYQTLVAHLRQQERWGELVEVLEPYSKLVKDPDQRTSMIFEMGKIAKDHLQDLELAAGYFKSCLQIADRHAGAIEELANVYHLQGKWDNASRLQSGLDGMEPDSEKVMASFRMGEAAVASGEDQQAALYFQQTIELNPSFIPARLKLIQILEKNSRYDQAIVNMEELLDLLPEEGFEELRLDLWLQMGCLKRRMFLFDESAKWYQMVLDQDPNQREALRVCKEIVSNQGRWQEAVFFARKELELSLQNSEAAALWAALGDIYLAGLDQPEEARLAYQESDRLDPDRLEIKWKLWELSGSDTLDESMTALDEQLLASSFDANEKSKLHRTLGNAYLQHGKRKEALDHFEQALLLGGGELEFVDQAAELAKIAENWPLWTSLAGQALEARIQAGLAPEEAAERYLKIAGVYREHMGDITRAGAAIRRALELTPRDPRLLRKLGTLYASDFETYRQAIEVFRELVGMEPSNPELHRYLARLESARGEMDRAACHYVGLRFLVPDNLEASKYIDHVGAALLPERALTQEEWEKVFLHPKADCLLQKIMSVLAPYLEQLFPADSKRQGLSDDNRVTGQKYPQAMEAMEIALKLIGGGRSVDLYHVPGSGVYKARLDVGTTASIVLSDDVLETSTRQELVFFITREMVKVSMGFALPFKLGYADLVKLLGILCKLAHPEIELQMELPKTTPQYLAAIKQLTPEEVWEQVRPLVRVYALEPRAHDIESWFEGIQLTADRVGLLACGNLEAALSILARTSQSTNLDDLSSSSERSALLENHPPMMSLFRFAFSEPFMQVRGKLSAVVKGA